MYSTPNSPTMPWKKSNRMLRRDEPLLVDRRRRQAREEPVQLRRREPEERARPRAAASRRTAAGRSAAHPDDEGGARREQHGADRRQQVEDERQERVGRPRRRVRIGRPGGHDREPDEDEDRPSIRRCGPRASAGGGATSRPRTRDRRGSGGGVLAVSSTCGLSGPSFVTSSRLGRRDGTSSHVASGARARSRAIDAAVAVTSGGSGWTGRPSGHRGRRRRPDRRRPRTRGAPATDPACGWRRIGTSPTRAGPRRPDRLDRVREPGRRAGSGEDRQAAEHLGEALGAGRMIRRDLGERDRLDRPATLARRSRWPAPARGRSDRPDRSARTGSGRRGTRRSAGPGRHHRPA